MLSCCALLNPLSILLFFVYRVHPVRRDSQDLQALLDQRENVAVTELMARKEIA